MTQDDLQSKIKAHQAVLKELVAERETLGRKVSWRLNKIKGLQESLDELNLEGLDLDQRIEYLINGPAETDTKHKGWRDLQAELGLVWYGGTWNDTNQQVVCIALPSHDTVGAAKTLDTQLKGLETLLPHIKPGDQGYKRIKILEEECGESGIYYLRIKDDLYEVTKTAYGRKSTIASLKTLAGCLHYISRHLPA